MVADKEMPELLCRVNFPLYNVNMISPRHVMLSGGGGAANTGVRNGFEIFEIGHNGSQCIAESLVHHQTGEFSCMNASASRYDPLKQRTIIAVGHNEKCQTYSLQLARERRPSQCNEDDETFSNDGHSGNDASNVRRRHSRTNGGLVRNNSVEDGENMIDDRRLVFKVMPLKSVITDYNTREAYQKVVKISPLDGKFMATGGEDGILRIWTFPDLNQVKDLEAHDKEIDDIEFSPDQTKVISISKDRRALVWDMKKLKKHAEMGWDPPNNSKYAYKRVRCGKVEGDTKKYKIFTIVNPLGSSKLPSYLQRWDPKSFTVEQAVSISEGSLSALAVSDSGDFVATGSMFDGTVEIYIAYNLKKLKRVENSHNTFITGLEFLPTTEESEAIRGFSDCSVISISVDHQVCIHHIPRLRKISMTHAGGLIFVLLILTFILCSYLGI